MKPLKMEMNMNFLRRSRKIWKLRKDVRLPMKVNKEEIRRISKMAIGKRNMVPFDQALQSSTQAREIHTIRKIPWHAILTNMHLKANLKRELLIIHNCKSKLKEILKKMREEIENFRKSLIELNKLNINYN